MTSKNVNTERESLLTFQQATMTRYAQPVVDLLRGIADELSEKNVACKYILSSENSRLHTASFEGASGVLDVEVRFFHAEHDHTPALSLAVVDDDDNSVPLYLYELPVQQVPDGLERIWNDHITTFVRDHIVLWILACQTSPHDLSAVQAHGDHYLKNASEPKNKAVS